MKSRRERLAALVLLVGTIAGCGLEPPKSPPPFHCEDYDAAAERFPATCAEDAGDVVDEDAGDVVDDAGDVDAGDVDGGP